LDQKDFVALVNTAIKEGIAAELKPEVLEGLVKKLQEQQDGTGQSGTGPTPSKDEFMKACTTAGGTEVYCQAQWEASASMLEEGKALTETAKQVIAEGMVKTEKPLAFKETLKPHIANLIQKTGTSIETPELIEARKNLVAAEAKVIDADKAVKVAEGKKAQIVGMLEGIIPSPNIVGLYGQTGGFVRLTEDLKCVKSKAQSL